VAPEAAVQLLSQVATLLDVQGMMAIGPSQGDPKPGFRELKALRDAARERLGISLPILSMGMSGDYEVAVTAGSTMLRLGRALLGPRP